MWSVRWASFRVPFPSDKRFDDRDKHQDLPAELSKSSIFGAKKFPLWRGGVEGRAAPAPVLQQHHPVNIPQPPIKLLEILAN